MDIMEYSLVYCPDDGKIHIGDACTEENESLVGGMTDVIFQSENYEGDGLTLTLKDFCFYTSADIALIVPNGTTILLKGENELKVVSDKDNANVGVLYSSGDMTITGDEDAKIKCLPMTKQGLWSRCICARFGNLDVKGGNIYTLAGDAKKSCGLYAGGHLFRQVENSGRICITGGTVYASAKTNAIRATDGKLMIEPPEGMQSVVINAKEYKGSSKKWAGDTVTQSDLSVPAVITFCPAAV